MRKSPRSEHPAVSAPPAVPAVSPAATDPRRRRFLLTLGVSGAGAAAASVAALPAVAEELGAAAGSEADGRYQDTAHVRHYYRTTRI